MAASKDDIISKLTRVPGIGLQTAKRLVDEKGISYVEDILKFSMEELMETEGIGEHRAKSILENLRELTEDGEKKSGRTVRRDKDHIVRHFVETRRWKEEAGIEQDQASVNISLSTQTDNIVRKFILKRRKERNSFTNIEKRYVETASKREDERPSGFSSKKRGEEGFTNGLLKKRKRTVPKRDKGMINGFRGFQTEGPGGLLTKRSIASYFVLFLLIGGVVTTLYIILPGDEVGIRIDGNFDDWNHVRAYQAYPAYMEVSPHLQIVEYRLRDENGFLYVYVHTDSPLFQSEEGVYSVHVFVDTHEWGGYDLGDIQAEYRIEVYGWDGDIKGASYYTFQTEHASHDWNGYKHKGSLQADHEGNELELKVWLPMNDINGPEVVIHTKCCQQHYVTAGRVRPGESSIISKVSKIGPDVVDPGEEFDILRLDTVSLSGDSFLDHFTLEYNRHSASYIEEISIYNENAEELLVPWTPFDDGIELYLDEEVGEETLELTVKARISGGAPTGSVVGLKVVDVAAGEGTASLLPTNLDNIYVGSIPDDITVNGAFVHWQYKHIQADPIDDLTPMGAWNPNIDIRRHSWAENDTTSFMIGVEGNMLGGAVIPYQRGRPPELVDSDGDGIPDIYDVFPNDFTNNGTLDSEMLTPEGLPDVDGDGVAEWPHGPDMWLNTTIPTNPDIPEEYWGKNVSRYIGPVELPVRTGEDTIRIFIDADGDPSTGYTASWMDIGADYMVIINGSSMEVSSAELLRYSGRIDGRSWETLGKVPIALNATSLETAVGIELSQDFQVVFAATDWNNNIDTAHLRHEYDTRTRSSTERYRLYLRENDGLLSTAGTEELMVNLQNKDGMREHAWTSEPFAGDFELSETISVHLHLAPKVVGENRPGLNITLYHEGGIIGMGEQPPISNPGLYTIMLDPGDVIIPAGDSLYVETVITGDPETEALEMDIIYNSQHNDSRLEIPTLSLISVDEVTTYDTEGNHKTIFEPGDHVEIRANVTHPISAELITEVVMSVSYPNGTVMLEKVNMMMNDIDPDSPPYWSNWTSSFYLEDEAHGGRYAVKVYATDVQNISAIGTCSFIVPMDPGVSVYPDGEQTVTGGTEAVYDIEVMNIGNVNDEYILSAGSSSLIWRTELRYGGDIIAVDENGNGIWDWVDPLWDCSGNPHIILGSQEYIEFQVAKLTPEGSAGETDRTRLYASSVNHSVSEDNAEFTTRTPVPHVMKTLYLHTGDTMDTSIGNSTETYTIPEDSHNTWYQEPPLAGDFALHGQAHVHLYLDPDFPGHTGPDVTIELLYDGELISGQTRNVDSEGWYEFKMLTDLVIPGGNSLEVKISVDDEGSVTLFYDSQEFDSRLEMETDTYVRVENITFYREGDPAEEFLAGDDILLEALVSDPLGSYDIVGTNLTVTDPHGTLLIDGKQMDLIGTDPGTPSFWKLYAYEFTLPSDASAGIYDVIVRGLESNGVTSRGFDMLFISSGVLIEPDNEDTGEPGDIISYDHTVQNTGNGTDIFDFIVSSSMGYNVSLYTAEGILMGTDIGGNGVWDYVNDDWDANDNSKPDTGSLGINETMDVFIEIEIPGGAASGNETTDIKATSNAFTHVHDSARDVTTIPEFHHISLVIILVLLFNLVIFKPKYPSP